MFDFSKTLTSEDMKKIVLQLQNQSSDLRKQASRLLNEIEDIRNYWTGYAADEFTMKCQSIYERIAKEAIAIENLISRIQAVIRKLETAEKEAANVFSAGGGFGSGGGGGGRF
jgi:uncharacterized protein YukE